MVYASNNDNNKVEELFKELEVAPAWNCMTWKDVSTDGPKLMKIIAKTAQMRELEVRNIIQKLLDNSVDKTRVNSDAWSKIYVLNRFYFAVPSQEKASNAKYFAGWFGVPLTNKCVNLLWPLQEGGGGELYLTGVCAGYSGPRYEALKEFDYFSATYGVRKLAKQSHR